MYKNNYIFPYFFKSIHNILKITWCLVFQDPKVLQNSKQFQINLSQYKSW